MYPDWSSAFGYFSRYFRISLLAAALVILLVSLPDVAGAVDPLPPPPELKNPSTGANLTGFFTSKTPYEFWLTCLICTFGLAVIYALMFAFRGTANARPEDIANLIHAIPLP